MVGHWHKISVSLLLYQLNPSNPKTKNIDHRCGYLEGILFSSRSIMILYSLYSYIIFEVNGQLTKGEYSKN